MRKRLSNAILDRIEKRLELLYPNESAGLMERLLYTVGRYGVGQERSEGGSLWDEKDVVLITYGDSIRKETEEYVERPLITLRSFYNDFLKGAIPTVHILPFYPWSSDDGFSVIDYREVDPDLGGWGEIEDLGRDCSLMFDLVLNHCSSESSWFKDFCSGIQPGRHYFLEMDPETDLSEVVRPRTSPLLTRTPTRDGVSYVWTTFSSDQVDLNWQNPDLLFEFIDILFLYISKGVRILRMDAVAFLWKELGTSCVHLPETHEMVKLFRDLCELVAPEVLVLTETNVPQDENLSYYGDGDEAHMVYNFSLPPLLLHGLLRNDATHVTEWAAQLPDPPEGCTYFNFSSSHDGIGVRPLKGILDEKELNFLVKEVQRREGKVNFRTGPGGKEEPYELNITYFSALSEPEDEAAGIARFLCSQALVLSLRGIPSLYIHSLTATPNFLEGVEASGQNRTINRKKWDDSELRSLIEDKTTAHAKVFHELIRLLRRRGTYAAFHPDGSQRVIDMGPSFFILIRTSPDREERIICIFNFSDQKQLIKNPRETEWAKKIKAFYDIVSGKTLGSGKKGITLEPYQFLWLVPRT
jgi:sucrose phosphorylase